MKYITNRHASVDQLAPFASILSAAVTELLKANAYGDGLLEAILEVRALTQEKRASY